MIGNNTNRKNIGNENDKLIIYLVKAANNFIYKFTKRKLNFRIFFYK